MNGDSGHMRETQRMFTASLIFYKRQHRWEKSRFTLRDEENKVSQKTSAAFLLYLKQFVGKIISLSFFIEKIRHAHLFKKKKSSRKSNKCNILKKILSNIILMRKT